MLVDVILQSNTAVIICLTCENMGKPGITIRIWFLCIYVCAELHAYVGACVHVYKIILYMFVDIFIFHEVFLKIFHILKGYLKDTENLPTQKFTFIIRKFFIISKLSLSHSFNTVYFSHWCFFHLVISLYLHKLRDNIL